MRIDLRLAACLFALLIANTGLGDEPIEFHRLRDRLPIAPVSNTNSRCAAFSTDGKWLACGTDAGRIVVRESGADWIGSTFAVESGSPTAEVQFIDQGTRLASLHADGKLLVWLIDDGSLQQELPAERYLAMTISPQTRQLFAVTSEPALQVWTWEADDATSALRMESMQPLDVAMTHASASRRNGLLLLAHEAGWQLWSLAPLKKRLAATLPANNLTAAEVSPGGLAFATGFADGKVRVRDAVTGGLIYSWERHPNAVTSLAFSRSGKTLLSSCLKDRFRVWDLGLGEPCNDRAIELPTILDLELSPDDQHLAAVGDAADVIYLKSRKITDEVAALAAPKTWNDKAVFAARIIPETSQARVVGKFSTPQKVDLNSGEVTSGMKIDPGERLHLAALSADAALAAYAYPSGIARVYNASSGDLLQLIDFERKPSAVELRPDGRQLAAAVGTQLFVIDLKTGEAMQPIQEIDSIRYISALKWSADGESIYVMGPDAASTTGMFNLLKWSLAAGKMTQSVTYPMLDGNMAISDDGQRLVTGGITGVITVFDENLNRLNDFECGGRGGIHAFRIIDKRLLAVGTYKGSVLLVDMISGAELSRFEPLPPSKGMPIRAIDIDRKQKRMIAAGGYDGEETMRIYSLEGVID